MKKWKILCMFVIGLLLFAGCAKIAVNEIYNKSYHIGDVSVTGLEEATKAAIERASPSVIGVSNYQRNQLRYKLAGTGSGVIYSCKATLKDGSTVSNCETTFDRDDVTSYNYFAVTNRHVVAETDRLMVYIGEEDVKIDANLIGVDPKIDLAVISFSHYRYLQPIAFADSDQLRPGNFSIAIGNPSGYEFYDSATFGIVSSPKRYLADDTDGDQQVDWDAEYIQHDVAINPGNSGGALINLQGELIGINTLKLSSTEIENMGFAIPSNVVHEIVSILETGSIPFRITLGINIVSVKALLNPEDYNEDFEQYDIPPEITYGLYVINVSKNQPADNYLFPDDIILSVNEVDIRHSYEFRKEINKIEKGGFGVFRVFRNNQEITVTIPF